MAIEMGLFSLSRKAGADLSGHQYKVVRTEADGDVILATTRQHRPLGINQRKPKDGQECTVMNAGVSKAVFGAALAFGTLVTAGADGKIVAVTANDNQWILGSVWIAAGADEIGSVLLNIHRADTTA